MVEKIADLKDQMLMRMEGEISERGIENADVNTLGKIADQIKDLAEAEKSCWEAEYYRGVAEAMEDGQMGYDDGMGYARGGQGGRSGYARGGQGGYGYAQGGRGSQGGYGYEQGQGYRRGYRRGYRGQSRDSQGRYTSRRGYRRMESYGHEDMMQEIKQMARQMMESADPQEKEQLKMQLRQMTEQM